jgi:polar amino acid transport system substrate-binding protein
MREMGRLAIRLLPVLALLATGPAGAEGLRLVTGPDYPPYAGPDLPQGGMATELVLAAFEAAGRPAEPIEFLPWKRGYQAVLDGEFDATFPYIAVPERKRAMLFSTELYDAQTWPVFRSDRMRPYTGPDSLIGLTLCQPVGYAPPAELLQLIDAGLLRLVQPASMPLCARQLLAGRVDLLANSPALFNTIVRSEWHGGPAPMMGDRPIAENPLFLLADRKNPKGPEIMAAFAKGLGLLRASGRYQAIVDRHLAPTTSTE